MLAKTKRLASLFVEKVSLRCEPATHHRVDAEMERAQSQSRAIHLEKIQNHRRGRARVIVCEVKAAKFLLSLVCWTYFPLLYQPVA
jgi:hypothetical protein